MIWPLITPPIDPVAASTVADRRIRAGCKRLEEEVVVDSTNDGGMGENPPISSVVVCGRVFFIGFIHFAHESTKRPTREAVRGRSVAHDP